MEKIRSMLFDRRFPTYFHYNLLNKHLVSRRIEKQEVEELSVSFTFDVEKDPRNNIEQTNTFINTINKFFESKKLESTLFIQANLVKDYSTQFRELQKKHELGLHGYAHELWGYEQWWNRKKSLSLEQKRRLISMSLEIFERTNLERPTSFRAPNLIINKKTLALIKDFDFKIDSSLPSYLGVKPLPKFYDGLLIIPHTANPIPKIQMKNFLIPFVYYEIFTLPYFQSMGKSDFLKFIEIVTSYQISFGFKPHLVFLAHSWEFTDLSITKTKKSLQEKYISLSKICNMLECNYQVEYLTLNNLAKKLGLID